MTEQVKTCPTLYIEPGVYHVMLSDWDVAFDMKVDFAMAHHMVFAGANAPTPQEMADPENAPAIMRGKIRSLQVARKFAICYAVANGYINPPKEAREQILHSWRKAQDIANTAYGDLKAVEWYVFGTEGWVRR